MAIKKMGRPENSGPRTCTNKEVIGSAIKP